MKKTILLFAFILLSTCGFSQVKQHKSTEKEKYYERIFKERKEPINPTIEQVLEYYNEFFALNEMCDFSPYSDSLFHSNTYSDSVPNGMDFISNWDKYDSLWNEKCTNPKYRIGKVLKSNIIKHEASDKMEVFLYEDSKFEDYWWKTGVWVAISYDKRKTWNYYYSGITQKQPLCLKWYSKLPLIKSDNEIQIEAALMQQVGHYIEPIGFPGYRNIKDGLVLTIDLETLTKDSDGDGLTDIVEAKFFTDPNNPDTDDDGFPDGVDMNPRFSTTRTETTSVVEAILYGNIQFNDSVYVSIDATPSTKEASDETETYLIVSDDPAVWSAQPDSIRIIVLTNQEFERHVGPFENRLSRIYLSPFFRVDNEENAFVCSCDDRKGYSSYYIKKTKKGWKIFLTSRAIS